jgi:hypothetical protein
MTQYKAQREDFLNDVLSSEGFSITTCHNCNLHPGILRCRTCQFPQQLCKSCFINMHQVDPWHHPEMLSGNFFKRTSLQNIGFVLRLGHQGEPCPFAVHSAADTTKPEEDDDENDMQDGDTALLGTAPPPLSPPTSGVVMTLVDSNGVFKLPVQECKCPHSLPRWRQLLQARLFPASTKRPLTAFTFKVLDLFEILHLECKISVMSCFKMLQRLTNEAFPHLVPVSNCFPNYSFALRRVLLYRIDTESSSGVGGNGQIFRSGNVVVQLLKYQHQPHLGVDLHCPV